MATTNPISDPASHDVFKLDKLYSPFSEITECNGRERIFQEQQAPGFLGAFLVERGEHLVSVTYQVVIIAQSGVAGFGRLDPLLAYCASLFKSRPAKGAKLIDLRLAALRIPQMALERLPYQQKLESGKWAYVFKFKENKRLQIAGGPVAPPRNTFEQKIAKAQDELKAATANADAAKAAAVAALAERKRRNAHVGGP